MGKIKTVPINDRFEDVLISAERYAIGRGSYLPPDIIQYIRVLLPYLSKRALTVLSNDITEDIERRDRLHIKLEYRDLWESLLNDVNDELVMNKLPFTGD